MKLLCLPLARFRRHRRRRGSESTIEDPSDEPPRSILATVTRTTTQTWEPARPGETVLPTRTTTISTPRGRRIVGRPRPLTMVFDHTQHSIIHPRVDEFNVPGMGAIWNTSDYGMVSHTTTGVVDFDTRMRQLRLSQDYNSPEVAREMGRRLSRRIERNEEAAAAAAAVTFPQVPVGELEAPVEQTAGAERADESKEKLTC